MKWSWKLATVAGIAVYVHATFALLIAWIAFVHWAEHRSVAAVASGVGFILALFGCVLLHELGHALAARRYAIRTRDITLLPIGGLARLERMPEDPRQELVVALAGPAVNVAIAALLFAGLAAGGGLEGPGRLSVASGPFVERLMLVNIVLALFNLVPAFPMDGGRVLRALLATRMEYTRATQMAASLGQGVALVFGLLGLVGNPFLIFIALFVWIGAEQEASLVRMRAALGGIPVDRAMLRDFQALSVTDPLDRAIELVLAGSQQDFPVLEGDEVRGILTRGDLVAALARRDRQTPVAEVMRTEFRLAESGEMLDEAFRRLQECECRTMPVLRRGRLAGLLTAENVGEFLMIQSALRARETAG
jgi:Zn-dependent protease/CBS domain-containing protein